MMHPRFDELLEELQEIHRCKDADYASKPLSNFRACESFGVPAWKGSLVRASDKWSRITQLADGQAPQVEDEKLADTLIDLAGYALITIILLEEEVENDINTAIKEVRSGPS